MTDNINGGKVIGFARRTDPETSKEAAREATKALRDKQRKVLQYGFECGPRGFTDEQLNESFGSHSSTWRSRWAELTALGYIADTGARVGERGRRHIVWSITAEGGHVHIYGAESSGPMAA